MDPNANLKEQLRLASLILNGDDLDIAHVANRLGELVEALNEWLSKGGGLPDAWAIYGERE